MASSASTIEWTMPGPNLARLATLLPHDPELQAYQPSPSVQSLVDAAPTTIEIIQQLCQGYAERVALKWCSDGAMTSDYTYTMTYKEVWEKVQTMATVLSTKGWLCKKEFVAVCGFASPGWVLVDILSLYLGAVLVPLPLNVPYEDLKYMLDESGARVVFVSAEESESLAGNVLGKEGACPSVEMVVVMDYGGEEKGQAWVAKLRSLLPASVVRVLTMQELLLEHDKKSSSSSNSSSSTFVSPAIPGAEGWGEEPNPLLGLMYTSGSTGRPKGAMYTETLMRALWHTGFSWGAGEIPVVSLGFLPLNHIVGRVTIYQSFTKGGVVYFVRRSDMSTLFEDFARAKPTKTMMVPRIANMAYETYQLKKAELLQAAGLSPTSSCSSPYSSSQQQLLDRVERAARAYIRDKIFGGRLLFAIVGTAPSSAAVSNLIQEACEMPMVEGYGSTELGGITIENHINDATVLKWKLIDVPELGYTLKDHPFPRGELLVRTTTAIPGYYKHPEATSELIDAEGFYSTGDIMEQRGERILVWIDRRKNVLKLAQGEYVSVSRLEALFSGSADISNIYLYGNSLRSFMLGVVVPSEGLVEMAREGWRSSSGGGKEKQELAERIKPLLRQRLDAVAKAAGLAAHEVPRDFIVQLDGFTRENSLLTDSNKLARARLKQAFGPRLEAMYTAVEERKEKRLASLQANPDASITEQVCAALEMTLGLGEEVGLDATFAQLGGDSLSAVRLTEHLKRSCGVEVPVAKLLNPTATMQSLVEYLEAKGEMKDGGKEDEGGGEEIYERVHGPKQAAPLIFAKDLMVEKFIPAAVLHPPGTGGAMDWAAKAGEGLGEGGKGMKGVLLTGANGFLGRFLLLELLGKLQGENEGNRNSSRSTSVSTTITTIYCIVRARNDAAAKARLWEAVGASLLDPNEERVVALAGDVSQPRLGLNCEEAYVSLTEKVDLVLHAGALVNHNLSYRELFGPNVLGTTNIMQFCLTPPSKPKPLHFISTVAVAMGEGGPGPHVTEVHIGKDWAKERRIGGSAYAEGYGASKWAAEVLLQDLNRETGLPVVAYRCSMILPHTSLSGQINVSDIFTRLIVGMIYTGVAPLSFTDGEGQAPHYDGSSVDFVAGAIVAIALEGGRGGGREKGCRLFHVVNPHRMKGASLDDIVGWVRSAGYPVEGVAPYQEWFNLFKSKLEALPSDKRAQSPLPVLHQWQTPLPSRKKMEELLVLDATCFRDAVKRVTKRGDVPVLSERYLHTCLYHMSVVGLIGATPVVAEAAVWER